MPSIPQSSFPAAAPAEVIRSFGAMSVSLASLAARYQSGSVPQALILSGPFGVGKKTLAILLCMCLFCREESSPCGTCRACKRIEAETHPNLLIIRAKPGEKSIKIDQVRDILAQLKAYPLEKGRRAVLLEDFDLFTVPAQNALLKAIEEPDDATVYLLTAENEKAVLPTILSRCHLQRMTAWPDSMLNAFLTGRGLGEHEAASLTALASGSPGTALLLQSDEDFWQLKSKADSAINSLEQTADLVSASDQLKDFRFDADQLLDYLETKAHADFSEASQQSADPDAIRETARKHRAMLEALFLARRQRASNVTWQGITDQLLLNLTEEQTSCPW